MQIYKTLMLDLINPNGYNIIYAMQADRRTRFISIGFTYDGSTYTIPDGATIIVEGKTANGKDIYHHCVIKDNMAIFELSEKILQSHGRSSCVLGIYLPATDQLLHSVDLYISIAKNPLEPSSITNSSEYSALVNTIMESKRLIEKTRENILIFKGIQKKWAAIKLDALETIAATNEAKDNAIKATEDLFDLETYVTGTEAIRQDNEHSREAQESNRQDNEDTRHANEAVRQDNEDNRNSQEDIREGNEETRKLNESNREYQENIRKENENTRTINEDIRKDNELDRQAAEDNRCLQEDTREDSEQIRINSEETRISEENTRNENEEIRKLNEILRQNNESERCDTEDSRILQESIRGENEEFRSLAEHERDAQEALRQEKEIIREANELIRQEQENTRQTDTASAIANTEVAIQDAIDATDNAKASATNADEKADKADGAADRANLAAEGCEDIIAGTGFISITEKGSADGLATLDSNKKLTSTQLPLGETTTTAFAGDRGKALEDQVNDIKKLAELSNVPSEITYECTGSNDTRKLSDLLTQLEDDFWHSNLQGTGIYNIKVVGEFGIGEMCVFQGGRSALQITLDFANAEFSTITGELIYPHVKPITESMKGDAFLPTGINPYYYRMFSFEGNIKATFKNMRMLIDMPYYISETIKEYSFSVFEIKSIGSVMENIQIDVAKFNTGYNKFNSLFVYSVDTKGSDPNKTLEMNQKHYMKNVRVDTTEQANISFIISQGQGSLEMSNVYGSLFSATGTQNIPTLCISNQRFLMNDCAFDFKGQANLSETFMTVESPDALIERCQFKGIEDEGRDLVSFNPLIRFLPKRNTSNTSGDMTDERRHSKEITLRNCNIEVTGRSAVFCGVTQPHSKVLFDNVHIDIKTYMQCDYNTFSKNFMTGIDIEGVGDFSEGVITARTAHRLQDFKVEFNNSSITTQTLRFETRRESEYTHYPVTVIGVHVGGNCEYSMTDSEINIQSASWGKNTDLVITTLTGLTGILVDKGVQRSTNSNVNIRSNIKLLNSEISVQGDIDSNVIGVKTVDVRANLDVQGCEIHAFSRAETKPYLTAGIYYIAPAVVSTITVDTSETHSLDITLRDNLFSCTTCTPDLNPNSRYAGAIVVRTTSNSMSYSLTKYGRLLVDGCTFAKLFSNTNNDESYQHFVAPSIIKDVQGLKTVFTNNSLAQSNITDSVINDVTWTNTSTDLEKITSTMYMPKYSNEIINTKTTERDGLLITRARLTP